jgi:deazaflavin-dependent oxidoreductase (nitroreductase family)
MTPSSATASTLERIEQIGKPPSVTNPDVHAVGQGTRAGDRHTEPCGRCAITAFEGVIDHPVGRDTSVCRRAEKWQMGFVKSIMIRLHRRSGDRFMGMDLLYLTTVGATTGQKRQSPVARFRTATTPGSWWSNGGSARHPSWYHNLVAHPDQVWIEVAGRSVRGTVEQLDGSSRDAAWQRIVASQPRFADYQRKTDRILPIVRLYPDPAM